MTNTGNVVTKKLNGNVMSMNDNFSLDKRLTRRLRDIRRCDIRVPLPLLFSLQVLLFEEFCLVDLNDDVLGGSSMHSSGRTYSFLNFLLSLTNLTRVKLENMNVIRKGKHE